MRKCARFRRTRVMATRLDRSGRLPVVIFSLVYLLARRLYEDWRRCIGWSASMFDNGVART